MCVYLKQIIQLHRASNKTGSRNHLFYFIILWKCCTLVQRWRIHTKGLHLAEILHMQGQNQISIQSCYMIWSNIGLIPGEKKTSSALTNWDINVCPVFYSFLLRWHLKIPEVFFSWSKGIHKCKYQPLYNQLQDPSFLKAPSQMLSLSTGLQSTTWKIVLNNQFFTAISSTSSK